MAASEVERAALAYVARGWSVVVVEPRGKRPIVRWQEFQQRLPGKDELRAWFERRHGALPHTVEAETGGGGRHLYFAHPGGEVRNRVGLAPGLDLRGDGGVVVAPPSLHPSAGRYRWLPGHESDETQTAPLPGTRTHFRHLGEPEAKE